MAEILLLLSTGHGPLPSAPLGGGGRRREHGRTENVRADLRLR